MDEKEMQISRGKLINNAGTTGYNREIIEIKPLFIYIEVKLQKD
jgi:hypothetical protein